MITEHFEHEGTLWVEWPHADLFKAVRGPMASVLTQKLLLRGTAGPGRWRYWCEKCELNGERYSRHSFDTPQEAVENIDCECYRYLQEKDRGTEK